MRYIMRYSEIRHARLYSSTYLEAFVYPRALFDLRPVDFDSCALGVALVALDGLPDPWASSDCGGAAFWRFWEAGCASTLGIHLRYGEILEIRFIPTPRMRYMRYDGIHR